MSQLRFEKRGRVMRWMGFAFVAAAAVLAAAAAHSSDPFENGDGTRWQSRLDSEFPVTVRISVGDIEEATKWYLALFDDVPMFRPLPTVTAFELVKGFWFELTESDRINPSNIAFNFGVKDLHTEQSRLQSRGVDTGEILRPDPRVSLIEFRDPDGNLLSFYELNLARRGDTVSSRADGQEPPKGNGP